MWSLWHCLWRLDWGLTNFLSLWEVSLVKYKKNKKLISCVPLCHFQENPEVTQGSSRNCWKLYHFTRWCALSHVPTLCLLLVTRHSLSGEWYNRKAFPGNGHGIQIINQRSTCLSIRHQIILTRIHVFCLVFSFYPSLILYPKSHNPYPFLLILAFHLLSTHQALFGLETTSCYCDKEMQDAVINTQEALDIDKWHNLWEPGYSLFMETNG